MSDKTCVKELNAQLQVMRSRLDTVEQNVRANIVSTFKTTIATYAGFLAEGLSSATAIFMADPLLVALAIGMVGGVDGWRDVINLAEDLFGADFSQLFARMMLDQLGLPSYSGALSAALEAAIASEIVAQQAEIQRLIDEEAPIEEIQAAMAVLQQIQDCYDSLVSALASQNNLSLCKTASSILNVV